jgi:hypothetical protein
MKKLLFIFALLVLALFSSCAAPDSESNQEAVDEIIEEETNDNEEELVEDEQYNSNEEINEIEVEPTNETSTENEEVSEEIKIDTGTFNGLADANFFEVKISGVPESIPPKIFMLTDDVREKFKDLALQQDDEIKIHYYETSDGNLIVTDIEKNS